MVARAVDSASCSEQPWVCRFASRRVRAGKRRLLLPFATPLGVLDGEGAALGAVLDEHL